MKNKTSLSLCLAIIILGAPAVFGQEVQSINTPMTDELLSEEQPKTQPEKNPLTNYQFLAGMAMATIGIAISAYFTTKALKGSKRKTEADLFLRLNESLYRSNEAKKIIESMRNGTRILKPKGNDGKDLDEKEIEKIIPDRIERDRLVEERDLENFLNEVQAVCILINHDILEPEFAEPGFSWVIQRVIENSEIKKYIDNAQKNNYGYYSWGEISMYAEMKKKFERADEYNKKIGFRSKSS